MWKRILEATGILIITVFALCLGGFLARDALFYAFVFEGTRADWDLIQLQRQVARDTARGTEGGPDESVRDSYIQIANANPDSRAEVTSSLLVVKHWPGTPEADVAFETLLEAAKTVDLGDWALSLEATRPSRRGHEFLGSERWRPLASLLIERVRQQPNHPKAARLLCEVAVALHPDSSVESVPIELIQIAELIQQQHATSPELANFCEVAGHQGNPVRWTQPFEPFVRHILDVNQDRFVRVSAHIALASIVRSHGATRQEEARQLCEEFLTDFDGEAAYRAQGIEQKYRQESEKILQIMSSHGIGMTAPETNGVDLDGTPLSLKDYRGKVVLVSFWATWCRPCMDAIPHERELLETFGQSEFAIFGINADKDIEKAKVAVKEHDIAWSSLRTRQEATSHANNWDIRGYPTFYLLDKQGVIANSWKGLPPDAELKSLIRSLIDSESNR